MADKGNLIRFGEKDSIVILIRSMKNSDGFNILTRSIEINGTQKIER